MKKNLGIATVLLTLAGAVGAAMPTQDTVKGVKDHPLLSRFDGAKLVLKLGGDRRHRARHRRTVQRL